MRVIKPRHLYRLCFAVNAIGIGWQAYLSVEYGVLSSAFLKPAATAAACVISIWLCVWSLRRLREQQANPDVWCEPCERWHDQHLHPDLCQADRGHHLS